MDVEEVFDFLPRGSLVRDRGLFDRYARDVTGRFSGSPAAIVRPAGVEELAHVLRACDDRGIGVVPQGGNTGLVGGAIPATGEIVLSLERLGGVGRADPSSRTLVAAAGATLLDVQAAAGAAALELPIDFAARGSATIGGMVATDAGGALTMRHGTMRDRVAGLQAVLAGGAIVDHLDRPATDSSGFDVTRLIPGSEGTLAVVTAVRLGLVRAPRHRTVALAAFDSLDDATAVTARLRDVVPSMEAADFFLAEGLDLVSVHARLRPPFAERHAAFVVVSCADSTDPGPQLAAALADSPEVADVAVAQSARQVEELWSYRELHNEAINAAGVPHKLDVAVPMVRVPELVSRVEEWLGAERPDATAIQYGHLGAGKVHVNVLGLRGPDDAVEGALLGVVAAMGGSISAEHGIGQAKTRWLHLTRPPAEIAAMKAVKAALDPNGILNPGKLLPA